MIKKKKNVKECKRMFEYLKATCHANSIKHYNNREYFTSCDVNLECMRFKSQFNHYCFLLYPDT